MSSWRGLGSCLWARAKARCLRGLAPNTGTRSILEMESESTAETRHPSYVTLTPSIRFLVMCVFYLQWCWASCLRQLRDWSELRKDRDTLVAVFVPSSGHQDIAPHWSGLVISTLRACQVFSRALITHGHIGSIIGTTSFLVFIHNSKPSVPTLNWLELAVVSYGNKMEYFHLHQFCDSNARVRAVDTLIYWWFDHTVLI